jgi:phosphoserine phosphatase RsbU/P
MPTVTLHDLFRKNKPLSSVVSSLVGVLDADLSIRSADGGALLGGAGGTGAGCPVLLDGEHLGSVSGGDERASVVAALLGQLAAREAERNTLASEVLHLYREINLIYRFSDTLSSTVDVERVAAVTLEQAVRLIRATDGAVLLQDETSGRLRGVALFGEAFAAANEPICAEGLFASILASGQGDIVNDAGADSRRVQGAPPIASVICTPLRVKERVIGLIVLSNASPVNYAAADLSLLNTLAFQTAAALENARLFERTLQAARDRERLASLQKELDVASGIQRAIVPSQRSPFADRRDFVIRASMTPARAVGGDFFDFFLIDVHRLGFVIADVSGKGVPSALFMAVCRTLIKATAQAVVPPDACLSRVNQVLASDGVPSMYVTVFYGVLDTRTGRLSYCNAGHNPPFVTRASGAVEPLAQVGGTVLGLFESSAYETGEILLAPGDGVFTYTDGVTEACDAAGDEFATTRLAPSLARCAGLPLDELIASVKSDVAAFVGDAPQADDITMLAVRYHGR